MTRRQSNNQWSGGIAAHTAPPQNIPSSKSPGKVLASIFWDQDGILLIDYLPKGQTINAEYYPSLLAQLKDILKEKCGGKFTNGRLVLARQCPGSPGTCNPEETVLNGLPLSGPFGLPPFSWTEKQLKSLHFSSDAEVIAAAETWLDIQVSEFFYEWLAKFRSTD